MESIHAERASQHVGEDEKTAHEQILHDAAATSTASKAHASIEPSRNCLPGPAVISVFRLANTPPQCFEVDVVWKGKGWKHKL